MSRWLAAVAVTWARPAAARTPRLVAKTFREPGGRAQARGSEPRAAACCPSRIDIDFAAGSRDLDCEALVAPGTSCPDWPMLILFDLDDTLLDDATATREAADALRDHLEIVESPLEFRRRWFDSLHHHSTRFTAGEITFQEQRRARIRDAARATLSDRDADAIFAIYLTVYEQSWRLFADVRPCLDALVQHRLGVVSNGNARQQRHKLARLGILDRFECVVVSEDCGWAKPDPRIFARACELGRGAPPDVVHVGDRQDIDVLGAVRAGLRAVWLDRHGSDFGEHASSDVPRLTTLANLPALVG
jgi:putative hydrolase of the HAD superfamily